MMGKNAAPIALKGPNGTVELRQMNAVQGWHSGYMTPAEAKALADELKRVAEEMAANA